MNKQEPIISAIKYSLSASYDMHSINIALNTQYKDDARIYAISYQEEKAYDPSKTKSFQHQISNTDINRLQKQIANLKVPVIREGMLGCDGETHTLSIHSGGFCVEYQWWGELPVGYEGLGWLWGG